MPYDNVHESMQTKTRLSKPKRYHVIFHNDDVTTMEFVVQVLRTVFFKTPEEATQLMLNVHRDGSANVGTYTYDIAASKANRTVAMARDNGYPLRVTIIPEKLEDLPF